MSVKPDTEPAIIVIFGITGDLSQRYLLPSLYHLVKDGILHPATRILGVTRGDTTTRELFDKVELCVNEVDGICDPGTLKAMHDRTAMFKMSLIDPKDYQALLEQLNAMEEAAGVCMNRLYYLSIPPNSYGPVVRLLGQNGLNGSCPHGQASTRLLVEKPFGFDLHSAKELIQETSQQFSEEQVFRIDHYMAKETVQHILTFRAQNPDLEALWNNQHIAGIDIVAKEKIGIEGRANFYEPLGALRDFIQSHLMQIAGIVTMDPPKHMTSEEIHDKKLAALEQIETVPADKVRTVTIRGQYQGYRDEVGNPDSITETYAAITIYSRNPRWQGVPLKLLTGKALDERLTEVVVSFKGGDAPRRLRFRIQPNESIEVEVADGQEFAYQNNFQPSGRSNAYERVLADALRGDHTLFATSGEILASWRILQPVVQNWSLNADDLMQYEPGTPGPHEP